MPSRTLVPKTICLGDRNDYGLKKLVSMVLLPLPTELADGLRLEGVSLIRFAPKIGSSAPYLALNVLQDLPIPDIKN